MNRVLQIGMWQRDWDWRSNYKPSIVATINRNKSNQDSAPKGGATVAERSRLAKLTLEQEAFRSDVFLKWVGLSKRQQHIKLRNVARLYDHQNQVDRLFTRSNGEIYSLRWFGDRLSEWRADGRIQRMLNKIH